MSKEFHSIHITTDINIECCNKTRKLCNENGVEVFPVRNKFLEHVMGPFYIDIQPSIYWNIERRARSCHKKAVNRSFVGKRRRWSCRWIWVSTIHCWSQRKVFLELHIHILTVINKQTIKNEKMVQETWIGIENWS